MEEYIDFHRAHYDTKSQYFDAFDLNCCVLFAFNTNRSPQRASDIFTSYEVIFREFEGNQEMANHIIERNRYAFENYQEFYKQHNYLYFETNLFTEKKAGIELAQDMAAKILVPQNKLVLENREGKMFTENCENTVRTLQQTGTFDILKGHSSNLQTHNIYDRGALLEAILPQSLTISLIHHYNLTIKT